MPELADAQRALGQAAAQLTVLDPDDWPGWVTCPVTITYLLLN